VKPIVTNVFETKKNVILASQSPRRQSFFHELGITFSVWPAEIDETYRDDEIPAEYVQRMALEKAVIISGKHPEAWVLAADTIVSLEKLILGKPSSRKEAVEMLMRLSGKQHEVRTSYCLCCLAQQVSVSETVLTEVRFTDFSRDIAEAYAATDEPYDKAGSYGIQGRGGMLIAQINGSYSNVVGLPLAEVLFQLQNYQVIVPRSSHPSRLRDE